MLPVSAEALSWLRKIRLTLIMRRVAVSHTVRYPLSEDGHRDARRAKPGVIEVDADPRVMATMSLASASRSAQRFLRRKNLNREDREDIIHDALMWCWENHASYSLTTSLETWFINAVRNMYQKHRRVEERAHGGL